MPSRVSYQPLWTSRFAAARRPAFPKQRGSLQTDVVVVGGGLTGCAIAYAFASAGVSTILLEEDRLGRGSTAASSGLLRPDPAASFREAALHYGLRDARTLWQATRRSALEFAATLRRLGVRCDVTPADALTLMHGSRDGERALRREYDAQRGAGLEVAWLASPALAREAAVDRGVAAIRTRDGAQMDPYRAALGLAAAAIGRGAEIFENTSAVRIRAGRKRVEVRTPSGSITAESVVVATGYPPADLKGLRRHFIRELHYCVATEPLAAAARRATGRHKASLEDIAPTKHTLRWLRHDAALFCGGAQPLLPQRSRPRAVAQRTWELMYELSLFYPTVSGIQPTHAWDLEVSRTVDGLPYLGTHRNYPRHLFALGIDPHRLGHSWLAARILLRHYQGVPERTDLPFGFSRIL